MSTQAIQELTRLVGADEGAIGFIETLPGTAQSAITEAVRTTLDNDRSAVDEAITQGLAELPAWLRGIAARLLG